MENISGKFCAENAAQTDKSKSILGLLSSLVAKDLSAENFEATLKKPLIAIADYLNADHAYIMLKNTNEDELKNTVSTCRESQADFDITASKTLLDRVVQTGGCIIVTDAMTNEQFAGDPDFQRFNISKAICAPIKTADSVPGVIYADSKSAGCKWEDDERCLFEFAAFHIGLVVDNANFQKQAGRLRGLVAAGNAVLLLSHSVKNILQMVGGAAEVIDFGLRTDQIHRVKRSWDILKPNLERMRKLTLDMLDYSKERKLESGPCDFNRVVQGAIESLKSQLKQKKTKLNIRVDQKIPTIELDSERIHEMVLNIILNAIDIVDENTGVVKVETRYLKDRQAVEFSVADNGPGMTEDIKKKIFTPFESKKNKFGTGLGMPIAKQIIDQHNGQIRFESELGKGTKFRIILPAKIVKKSNVPARHTGDSAGS